MMILTRDDVEARVTRDGSPRERLSYLSRGPQSGGSHPGIGR